VLAGIQGHHELVELVGGEVFDGAEAGDDVESVAGELEDVGLAA
jgi:NTP pyrophosphatase (non-canonical NTP hydrolase)